MTKIKIIFFGLLFLVLGVPNVIPFFNYFRMPGDMGDPRFNLYILEHFYQTLLGNEESLINIPMFYPWKYVAGFSDHHWGMGLLYSLIRTFEINQNTSLAIWLGISILLNYLSTNYVLYKSKLSPLAASFGAFLFTFSLPAIHMPMEHIQLAHRWLIPWTIYFLQLFLVSKKTKYFNGFILALILQLCISFYIGYFLAIFALCFSLAYLFINYESLKTNWENISNTLKIFLNFIFNNLFKNKYFWITMLLSTFLLVLFYYPYLLVKNEYHFSRDFRDIKKFLPKFSFYFTALPNHFFEHFYKIYPHRSTAIFPGVIPLIFLLFSLLSFHTIKNYSFRIYSVALLLAFLLTYNFEGLSLYYLFVENPLNPLGTAARVVTRIILIFLLPMGLIAGVWLDKIYHHKSDTIKINFKMLAYLICFFTVIETYMIDKAKFTHTIADEEERIYKLEKQLPKKINKDAILVIGTENKFWYHHQIDAIHIAQKYHLKTLNGYSGWFPPEWVAPNSCDDLKKLLQVIQRQQGVTIKQKDLIMINYGECNLEN